MFSPTERSAPVASLQHLCARACAASRERAFVTASRGGGRRTEDRSRGKRSSCRAEEEEEEEGKEEEEEEEEEGKEEGKEEEEEEEEGKEEGKEEEEEEGEEEGTICSSVTVCQSSDVSNRFKQ